MSAEERFKAIRERLDAATPGEWCVVDGKPTLVVRRNGDIMVPVLASVNLPTNATFIANAPDDIAFLLDALAQVEEERDALRGHAADLALLLAKARTALAAPALTELNAAVFGEAKAALCRYDAFLAARVSSDGGDKSDAPANEPECPAVPDLMAALEQSIAAARASRPPSGSQPEERTDG